MHFEHFGKCMAIIATAGHVDHGKTSLIRAITGTDPDRLKEEKRRGLTIDLGFAHVTTPRGITLSFIDVPGHIDFIRTMISGVSGVSIAVLVIDAAEGWKPQTEEHLGILSVLKVSRGVVALTKCDRVNHEELLQREQEIARRLASSAITWSGIIRTSTVTNDGISDLVEHLETLTRSDIDTQTHGRPRLFIDRVFTIKGSGTVVTGTLEGGNVSVGDVLTVVRSGATVTVREAQQHGSQQNSISPGSRCALNLSGIDRSELRRGDSLVHQDDWHITNVFDGTLETLASLQKPITHRGNYMLHIGTHVQEATLRVLRDSSIAPGESCAVRIRFSEALPLRPSDRFLIRETGIDTTIGGGAILDVDPQSRLSLANPDGTIESQLVGRGFLHIDEARRLTSQNLTPRVGHWFAADSVFEQCLHQLEQQLNAGPIDVSQLQRYEQAILEQRDDVVIENGIARRRTSDDPLLKHPYVELFRSGGIQTPDKARLDRNVIRQLVQKGVLYEHDNIAFHVDVLVSLRPQLEQLWQQSPDGFTMSQLRETLGITRKHAVPLATCLDKLGLTKRVGDIRVRGYKW